MKLNLLIEKLQKARIRFVKEHGVEPEIHGLKFKPGPNKQIAHVLIPLPNEQTSTLKVKL